MHGLRQISHAKRCRDSMFFKQGTALADCLKTFGMCIRSNTADRVDALISMAATSIF